MNKKNNKLVLLATLLLCAHASVLAQTPSQNAQPDILNVIGDILFALPPTLNEIKMQPNNIGMAKVGIGGSYQIAAQFKEFKLACDKNQKNCDVDIDNFSLKKSDQCQFGQGCMAQVDDPSIEFAISNPFNLNSRKLVGVRLLLSTVNGDLTAGKESDKPNGINSLTGYVPIAKTYGGALTVANVFGIGNSKQNEQVKGFVDAKIIGCVSGCNELNEFYTKPAEMKGMAIQSLKVPFDIPAFEVYGQKSQFVVVKNIHATIPDVALTPNDAVLRVALSKKICVTPLICVSEVDVPLKVVAKSVKANITLHENLGFIHRVPLQNNTMYIGLQRVPLQWSNAKEVALPGVWMSFQKPIQLGKLYTQKEVDITSMYPSLAAAFSQYFKQNPISVDLGKGINAVLKGEMLMDLGDIFLQDEVAMTLSDMPIGNNDKFEIELK